MEPLTPAGPSSPPPPRSSAGAAAASSDAASDATVAETPAAPRPAHAAAAACPTAPPLRRTGSAAGLSASAEKRSRSERSPAKGPSADAVEGAAGASVGASAGVAGLAKGTTSAAGTGAAKDAASREFAGAKTVQSHEVLACFRCTLHNPPGTQLCQACGAALRSEWACSVCTLLNAPASASCAACETPRSGPQRSSPPGKQEEPASSPTRHADDPNCLVLAPAIGLAPRFSLVFLHGFCNTAEHYADSEAFTLFRFRGLRVVLPTAPVMKITAHGGYKQNAWYNYLTDFDGAKEDDIDEASLAKTTARLHRLIDTEAALVGGHDRVVVGGASQGCCAAFDAFARHKKRLAGFVGFVGHPLKTTRVSDSAQRSAACGFFNGGADTTMRPAWVRPAIDRLAREGWTQVRTEMAEGAEHDTSTELENEWMDSFLEPLFDAGT